MCAILGGTNVEWDYKAALETMTHRGPDATSMKQIDGFTMGFNRLSIMDLSDRAMQPMESNDGNVVMTYNGEIYAYSDLKLELIKAGYDFKSTSDSEVLLNAYCEWGETFVDKIDGMFAVAIYDKRKKKVILYRDRAGIKPLYYYYDGKNFAYASELKALVALLNNISLEIDKTALFDYYNYLYIPEPKSIYKNIYKLEPGHKLLFNLSDYKEEILRYWKLNACDLEDNGNHTNYTNIEAEIRELIRESVRNQLIADVPVGVFLSGGIDSSVVTIESIDEQNRHTAFSVGFYDYERNELPYVRCLEDRYGFRSIKYYMKKDDYVELFEKLYDWYDEPYGDTSAFPSYICSREARKSCKVVLSGDGGDEIFGGYYRYKQFNQFCHEVSGKDIERDLSFINNLYLFHPHEEIVKLKKRLGIDNDYDALWLYRKYYEPDLPPITRIQYLDYHTYLCGDILTKMDRVSMAVSLEVRVPLLAKKLVEYSFSLSQNERCPKGDLKGALKQAYKGRIPNNLLFRRKAGFSIPDSFYGYNPLLLDNLYRGIFEEKLHR